MFSGWHLLTLRGHPIAGRRYRGLLWWRSVRKIEEGRAGHRFEVTV
jgi:hypothetical protein